MVKDSEYKSTAESSTTIIITSSRKERNGRYDPTLNEEDDDE
jgi:hypothetical protein